MKLTRVNLCIELFACATIIAAIIFMLLTGAGCASPAGRIVSGEHSTIEQSGIRGEMTAEASVNRKQVDQAASQDGFINLAVAGTGAGVMVWLAFSGYRDWLKYRSELAADREETVRMRELLADRGRGKICR